MTTDEDRALTLLITIIAEMNDMELGIRKELAGLGADEALTQGVLTMMLGLLDTLRCDHTQEELNELATTLVEQQEI